ncbi:MAG: FHA domain-containing protein [Myxococcota bacterium]
MSEAFAQIRLSGGRSDHRDWSIHSAVSMARIDVGSSSRCAWTVLGQGVARHHFEFYWDGEVLWVADLRQTGGVTLNGVPLSKQWSAVVTGASIVFGEAHMSCVTSVPASGTRALPPFENEPTRHEIQMPDQLRDRPSFAEQEDRTADVFVPLRSKAPRSMVPPGPAGLSSGHSGPGLTGPPRSSNASPGRDPAGELEQLPEQKTMVFQPEQRSSNASSIRFGATKEGSDLPRFAPRSAASPQAHFDDSVTRIRAADSVSPSAPPIDMARTPRRSGGDSYSGADRDGARSLHTEPLSTARSPSVPPPASYPPSREAFGAGPRSEWFHRESQPHRSSTGFESDRGRAVESRAGARFADPPRIKRWRLLPNDLCLGPGIRLPLLWFGRSH